MHEYRMIPLVRTDWAMAARGARQRGACHEYVPCMSSMGGPWAMVYANTNTSSRLGQPYASSFDIEALAGTSHAMQRQICIATCGCTSIIQSLINI